MNEIWFIENLNFNYFKLIIIIRAVYYKIIRRTNIPVIYFIDGSKLAQSVLGFLLRRFKINLEQLKFDFNEIKDENGVLLGLKIIYLDQLDIGNKILSDSFLKKAIERKKMRTEEKMYIKRKILEKDIYGSEIKRAFYLVRVAVWHLRNTNIDQISFFMSPRVWKKEILRYGRNHGVNIIFEGALNIVIYRLFKLLGQSVKGFYKLVSIKKILRYIKNQFEDITREKDALVKSETPKKVTIRMKPYIAVPYWGNLNLAKPELQSELFFMSQSKLSGKDILMIFDLPIDPFDTEKESELKKNRIKAISLNSKSTVLSSNPMFRNDFNFLYQTFLNKGAKLLSAITAFGKYAWLKEQLYLYEIKYSYWLQLFRDYNIKIYINWWKHDASHIPVSAAIKELGGINVIYQRSFDDLPYPYLMTTSDIIFSFDKNISNEQKIGSKIRYHVAVGFIGDYRFKLLEKPAKSIRDQLMVRDVKHIIAYFDENTLDDNRWMPGHKSTRLNYEFLLEKVLSCSSLGLILKPKNSSDLRKRLGSTVKMLEVAESTGRCIVLGGGKVHNSYPPSIASLASDIAVSGPMYGGTAGFESALTGVPTLMLDQEGCPESKLYDLGLGKVVFNDWNSLWDACKDYFDSNCQINDFGDWSPLLNEWDTFRDGRAAERIGNYLHWLITDYKNGLPRETIMANTAERYCQKWGYDKITSV